MATGAAAVCSGSALPAGHVILYEQPASGCPSKKQWVVGLPAYQEAVCYYSPVPRDYVVTSFMPASGGSSPCAPLKNIKLAEFVDRACAESPLPPGYVRTHAYSVKNPSTSRCSTYHDIKLAGEMDFICEGSRVPAGYRVFTTSIGCGNYNSGRWMVRSDGRAPSGGVYAVWGTRIEGWACQPDHSGKDTEIHLYARAPYPDGRKIAAFRTRTDPFGSAIPAVERLCGTGAPAYFSHTLTSAQVAVLGAGNHVVYAHALDRDGTAATRLGPSRIMRVSSSAANVLPVGQLMGITADGMVYGWACQLDHRNATTEIHLYADEPWPRGRKVATLRTAFQGPGGNLPWTGWEGMEGCTRPGFRYWLTPQQAASISTGTRRIYAHALDVDGGQALLPTPRTVVVPLAKL